MSAAKTASLAIAELLPEAERIATKMGLASNYTDAIVIAHQLYLDAEHSRRMKFEAEVLERLGRLDALFPERDPEAPNGRCDRCRDPLENVYRQVGRQRQCARGCVEKTGEPT